MLITKIIPSSLIRSTGSSKAIAFSFIFTLFVGLVLQSDPVHASSGIFTSSPEESIIDIVSEKPNPKVDGELAHLWFELMFGEFIWTPWGEGCSRESCATVLAKAVGFTNILALLLGIVIAYYVLLGGALNSAHTGEVLGKSWSSVWLPIRSAVGFGMIMPAVGIGGGVMSSIQVFVIWLIIIGSNAASMLWETTAEEFAKGTPVVITNNSVGLKPTADMFSMMVCARGTVEATVDKGKTGPYASIEYYSGSTQLSGRVNRATEITMRAGSNVPDLSGHIKKANIKSVEFGEDGKCGEIGFSDLSKNQGDSFANSFFTAGHTEFKNQLSKTLKKLSSLTNDVYKANDGSGEAILVGYHDGDKESVKDVTAWKKALFTAALDFDMQVRSEMVRKMSSQNIVNQWKKRMTEGGWVKAGVWYFEVSRFQGTVTDTIQSAFGGIGAPGSGDVCSSFSSFFGTCDDTNVVNMLEVSKLIASKAIAYSSEESGNKNISANRKNLYSDQEMFEEVSATQSADSISSDPEGWSKSLNGSFAKSILNTLASGKLFTGDGVYGQRCVDNARTDYADDNNKCSYGSSSPFQVVSNIGHSLKGAAVGLWSAAGVGYALSGSIDGVGDSALGLVGAKAGTNFIVNFIVWAIIGVVPLVMAALVQGFALAFVVPFMPLLTWIFMIGGYLVSVVEAVVAAPLAVIMMVTPEGEGISGTRLERGMSLIAMVVLKPSLMVVGLIASLTLGNILFAMMNQFFWSGVDELTSYGLLELIFVLTIYVVTAYKLCQYTVSIMYRLPDHILEWFTSGAARPFGEAEVGQVAQGAGSAAGNATTSAGQAGLGAFKDRMQNKFANQAQADATGASVAEHLQKSGFIPPRS